MVGKAKWKPLELPLPRKIGNQKEYYIPKGMSAIIKDLKDIGVVIPATSPIQLIYLVCAEGRWTLENDSGLL